MTHPIKQYMKRGALLLLALLITTTSSPVYATTSTSDDFNASNNITLYSALDTTKDVCVGTYTQGVQIEGTDNVAKIWNYLIKRGLSAEQAAGILGNIEEESRFGPTTLQSSTKAWGIVQWLGDRKTKLQSTIREKEPSLAKYLDNPEPYGDYRNNESRGYVNEGVSVEDNDKFLSFQLDFAYQEASVRKLYTQNGTSEEKRIKAAYGGKTEWEAIKASPTIKDASNIWLFSFERPGPAARSNAGAEGRAKNGQAIFDRFAGAGASADGTDAANPQTEKCDVIGSSGFAGTVQDFVLPDWHERYYTGADKARPAYVAAANKAKSAGEYVGTGAAPTYADCGGFVTILLRESGFAPGYNYSGKGGNTVSQKKWLDENWENLGLGSQIDTATLQPGDVFMKSGHTFVYIGDVPGVNSKIASASMNERVPMAGKEQINAGTGSWYRSKGTPANAN